MGFLVYEVGQYASISDAQLALANIVQYKNRKYDGKRVSIAAQIEADGNKAELSLLGIAIKYEII